MPANQGKNGPNWNPRPDFQRAYDITAALAEPQTEVELQQWLDDTSALPEAEVYRHLDASTFHDVIAKAADRIILDIKGGYYTASEATEWYCRKHITAGNGTFAVCIRGAEREVLPLLTST